MSNRNNDIIKKAIRHISLRGYVNQSTGAIKDLARITGFVAKIHEDESDELYGTIDVQEFDTHDFIQEENGIKYGYHEGVLLSALQNNKEGYLIVPKLHSEVTIALDPESQKEYVVMFSHVDLIQLDAHETISIGVRERKEFDDDEDGPDVHELEPTGVKTNIHLSKDTITTTVNADGSDMNTVVQVLNEEGLRQVVGDNASCQTITKDEIILEHNAASVALDDSQAAVTMGSSSVTVEDGTVYVGSTTGTDDAVLGQQLASILSELMGYLGQMMTPTLMGPQPPANVLGSFISLKAKIQSFASSHSGFLTQKVQIQK